MDPMGDILLFVTLAYISVFVGATLAALIGL
jgi:hypothetical protein